MYMYVFILVFSVIGRSEIIKKEKKLTIISHKVSVILVLEYYVVFLNVTINRLVQMFMICVHI
jgi:hypothetical protein